MGMCRTEFGKTKAGEQAYLYTIANTRGMSIEVTNYGAALVAVNVPDKNGRLSDVVLGYDDVIDYEHGGSYFGATIGRNGNRIGRGQVTINGTTYELDKNEKEKNNLHSGFTGYDRVIWDAQVIEEENTVKFHRVSPHMEQGFPGNFDITVAYTLTEENEVKIHYFGTCDQDTIANMTNHSYFNLSGHGSGLILGHEVTIDADAITAVDAESIPTGELMEVEGTPFDFRQSKAVGKEIDADFTQLRLTGGYDHNYVLNHQGEGIRKVARVADSVSGREMEVYTDAPGVQFYTGNFITPCNGKEEKKYEEHGGLCLETQVYPDANHHAEFPTSILKAGQVYDTTTIYKFLV